MDSNTLTLGNGGPTLIFNKVSAWDFLLIKKELGSTIADADPMEAGLFLSWRAAVAGGWATGFQKFCEAIPADQMGEVTEIARPFFSLDSESKNEES